MQRSCSGGKKSLLSEEGFFLVRLGNTDIGGFASVRTGAGQQSIRKRHYFSCWFIRKIAILVSNQRRKKWANCQLNTVLSRISAREVCSQQKVISSHITGYLSRPGAWRMRNRQFQNQVSWYIKTSLKLPEILYSKCAEANISISETTPSWSNCAHPHV